MLHKDLGRDAPPSRAERAAGVVRRRRRLQRAAWLGGGAVAAPIATLAVGPGPPVLRVAVAIGLATVLAGGAALALARPLRRRERDVRERGIRDPGEVEAALGLPVLGSVPRLGRGIEPVRLLRAEEAASPYAEAVGAVLAALDSAAPGGRRPKVLLVTSTLPGEGKTTLAVSLAALAARSGRTLLIDLDLRQPNVHRVLGREIGAGGVVEHLANGRPLAGLVQHDPGTGLDFLPVGARTEDPTDLIEGERMRQLVEGCRAGYARVVIDSAPVGIITDTRLAARLADAVLFAAQWDRTPPRALHDGVGALRASGVEPAGVVLTQADAAAERGGGVA